MQGELVECRMNLKRFRGPLARGRDRITRPKWLDSKHPLDVQFRERARLLAEGKVYWGCIVQANQLLFDPGPDDCPAAILFGTDPECDNELPQLQSMAHRLFDEKETEDRTPELEEFGRILADEYIFSFNLPVPNVFTDGRTVFYTSTLVCRRHLPDGKLTLGFFPYLAAPDLLQSSMIVPSSYWAARTRQRWLTRS